MAQVQCRVLLIHHCICYFLQKDTKELHSDGLLPPPQMQIFNLSFDLHAFLLGCNYNWCSAGKVTDTPLRLDITQILQKTLLLLYLLPFWISHQLLNCSSFEENPRLLNILLAFLKHHPSCQRPPNRWDKYETKPLSVSP